MPNRSFDTNTWTDPWVETLSPMQRLLFFYCWTNNHCTQCGMYYITEKRISSESGMTVAQVTELLPTLTPKVFYDKDKSLLWVVNFVKKQRCGNTFLVAVEKSLNKITPHPFVKAFLKEYQIFNIAYQYPTDRVEIGYISDLICSDKVLKGDARGKRNDGFIKPTLEEIKKYCLERKNGINPQKWFDFYSAKNWMIGKNKMVDWKAAVRTWENPDTEKEQAEIEAIKNRIKQKQENIQNATSEL